MIWDCMGCRRSTPVGQGSRRFDKDDPQLFNQISKVLRVCVCFSVLFRCTHNHQAFNILFVNYGPSGLARSSVNQRQIQFQIRIRVTTRSQVIFCMIIFRRQPSSTSLPNDRIIYVLTILQFLFEKNEILKDRILSNQRYYIDLYFQQMIVHFSRMIVYCKSRS